MSLKNVLLVGAVAALAITGCSKDEAGKQIDEAGLRGGDWYAKCDSTNLIAAAAGINSSRVVLDFDGDHEKRIQLFSDGACATQVAQATYTGTADVGTTTSFDSSARILDLNYLNVSLVVSDQSAINAMNTFTACGINDWAVGAARDVTANAGGANCLFVPKPAQSFDVEKNDGRTLFLGLKDATHDGTTQDKRPVALDMNNGFEKR